MGRIQTIIMLVVLGIPGLAKFNLATVDQFNWSLSYTTHIEEVFTPTRLLDPMEALDLVKEAYATNFTKNSLQDNPKDYFYKLDIADYYLVYEDTDVNTGYYLYHLYEYVLDDMDTGIGHTVTYGWYWVNPSTSEIWDY